jgi:fatty acyl-CoA reductase
VSKYSSSFAVAVVRPSVIVGAWRDPLPGWVEGFSGVTGETVAMCVIDS